MKTTIKPANLDDARIAELLAKLSADYGDAAARTAELQEQLADLDGRVDHLVKCQAGWTAPSGGRA